MRHLAGAALAATLIAASAAAPVAADDTPTFQNGFGRLAEVAPNVVGVPVEDEHDTGAAIEQSTTTGRLVWKPGLPAQWQSFDALDHAAWIPGRGVVTLTSESPLPPAPPEPTPMTLRVRLTYYVLDGRMANGRPVHQGAAACSSNIPMGATITFPDGERVVCEDTGRLGSTGWVDVWQGQALSRKYGQSTTVRVE